MHATVQTSIVSLYLKLEIIPVYVFNCQSNLEKQKQRGMFELNYNFTDDLWRLAKVLIGGACVGRYTAL